MSDDEMKAELLFRPRAMVTSADIDRFDMNRVTTVSPRRKRPKALEEARTRNPLSTCHVERRAAALHNYIAQR
jgi:hypothetical protein